MRTAATAADALQSSAMAIGAQFKLGALKSTGPGDDKTSRRFVFERGVLVSRNGKVDALIFPNAKQPEQSTIVVSPALDYALNQKLGAFKGEPRPGLQLFENGSLQQRFGTLTSMTVSLGQGQSARDVSVPAAVLAAALKRGSLGRLTGYATAQGGIELFSFEKGKVRTVNRVVQENAVAVKLAAWSGV